MKRLLAALLALVATVATAAPLAAPELAPYRALARNPLDAAGALQAARIGLATALGESDVPSLTRVPEWPGSPRPVYVTLVRGRASRACVGSDVPLGGSLAATLMQLGERLADSDLRRAPVRPEELDTLRLVVAFASDPVAVSDPMTVDPAREGLKIESVRGAIAFLPGEARTVAWALREARRVGVLVGTTSEARCFRFSVVTLSGPATTRSHRSSGEKP
ncbi:MAG: AMMECR1 domain-containing protein [Candidatus Eisenbacteria bacterium]|nr:AMMECR1 domain-containing protein [Candidatus Eisenbacteria bacterium]